MPFHRYVTPSYFGGMPGGYDLINVTSGGVGASDGSALVAAKKPGPHPNAGTYFVAFGEDATSADANRGFKALAENSDLLDDAFHADQSIPVVSAVQTPGSALPSTTIPGYVFVGGSGETNDQRTRSGLVAVIDGDGFPLHIFNGSIYVPVVVSSIQTSGGSNVVGSGYYLNPTVLFAPAIPSGQPYRLAYYQRSNLISQPTSTYSRLANGIRGNEDLWAYSKTTRLAAVTFTGAKVFQDPVAFQGTVLASAAATFNSTTAFNDTATFNDSILAEGTVQFDAAVTFSGTSTATFQGTNTFASTADFQAGFTADVVAIFNDLIQANTSVLSTIVDSTVPVLTTNKKPSDDSALSTDLIKPKLLFSAPTAAASGNATYLRFYSFEANGLGEGTGLMITQNARYTPGSSTPWSADNTALKAIQVIVADGPATVFIYGKAVTTSAWIVWDLDDGTVGNIAISGSYLYTGPRTRTVMVPLASAIRAGIDTSSPDGGWTFATVDWASTSTTRHLKFQLPKLPEGQYLSSLRVLVKPGSTGTLAATLTKLTHNLSTPAAPSSSTIGTISSNGTNALQLLSIPNLPAAVANENTEFYLTIAPGQSGDFVYSVEAQFTDSGPVNY